MLLGVGLGGVLTALVLIWMGQLKQVPSLGTLATLMTSSVLPASARERARHDVLAFIATGGRPALQELAAASGLTETEVLSAAAGATGAASWAAMRPDPQARQRPFAGVLPPGASWQ